MSQLDQERTCGTCGGTFRLSEHGVTGARAVAQALEAKLMTIEDAPPIVSTCPKCMGTERMDEETAHAELFRLEHAASASERRQLPKNTKGLSAGLAFIGLALAGAGLMVGTISGNASLALVVGALGGTLVLAGVLVGVIAVARLYGKRKSSF